MQLDIVVCTGHFMIHYSVLRTLYLVLSGRPATPFQVFKSGKPCHSLTSIPHLTLGD